MTKPKPEAKEEEMKLADSPETENKASEEKQPASPVMVEINEEELKQLREDAENFKEKYWLLLAESENQRKRMLKERQDYVHHAVKNVLVEILHPLDNMGNALGFADQMSDEVKAWATGFQMILTQFKDVLANQDIHSYDSEGARFDPHLHEAVETLETEEVEDGRILQEFVKGYKMGDRVIRPARVKVSKNPTKVEPAAESQEPAGDKTKEMKEKSQ